MEKPTNKQIQDVMAGVAAPDVAKAVACWFGTDDGSAWLSAELDKEATKMSADDADLLIGHKVPSDSMWEEIMRRMRRQRVRRMVLRVAAVLIPFVLLAGLCWQLDSRVDLFGTTAYEEVVVPRGERLQVMFQDGTRAYVNSGSRLRYPQKFGLGSREVSLSGEAYFVVAKNRHRPFMVRLDGLSVKVTGTQFNVQAYPDEKKIVVCLDRGSISMLLPNGMLPVTPGQRFVYDKLSGRCTVEANADSVSVSAWKRNVISFKDAQFNEVAARLQRWYNVRFAVPDNIPSDLLITLVSDNAKLENVLCDLQKITPLKFSYDATKRTVTVRLARNNQLKMR